MKTIDNTKHHLTALKNQAKNNKKLESTNSEISPKGPLKEKLVLETRFTYIHFLYKKLNFDFN